MRKVILVMLILLINLSLIGCSTPKQKLKNVTNDYYNALVNGNYEKAFEVLYLYDFVKDKHPTDGTTLSKSLAKEFYLKKVNVLKENNYKVTDFKIAKFRQEDGHTFFAEITLFVELNGERFEWSETVDEWEGKVWIINGNDPFLKYRDGKLNFDIEEELKKDTAKEDVVSQDGGDMSEQKEVAISGETGTNDSSTRAYLE